MNSTRVFLGLSLLAGLVACGGGGGGSDAPDVPQTGRLKVSITDAAVDTAEKVVVEFTGVELIPASGTATTITFATPKSIDLLALQNGNVAPLVTETVLPAGQYSQMRLMVNAEFDNKLDSYIQISGAQHELRVPSGSETGLKLVQGFTVPAGGLADFTIDFDLRKSVVQPTGQPGYFLKPVLRLVNNVQVGSVAGEVAPGVIAAQCTGNDLGAVYVYSGAGVAPDDVDGIVPEPITSAQIAFSNGMYSYKAAFLTAGAYTLAYTCQAAFDEPEVDNALVFVGTQNVTVAAGGTTPANF